jgi:hypothetical protein
MFSPQFFKESLTNVGLSALSNIFLTEALPSSVPGLMTVRLLVTIYHSCEFSALHTVLVESWEQCKDADVLLESPSAMAGVHIAEALRELLHYAILAQRRTLIRPQISPTSGPSPCPGQSLSSQS